MGKFIRTKYFLARASFFHDKDTFFSSSPCFFWLVFACASPVCSITGRISPKHMLEPVTLFLNALLLSLYPFRGCALQRFWIQRLPCCCDCFPQVFQGFRREGLRRCIYFAPHRGVEPRLIWRICGITQHFRPEQIFQRHLTIRRCAGAFPALLRVKPTAHVLIRRFHRRRIVI